jgi:glutamate--cysteine ligase
MSTRDTSTADDPVIESLDQLVLPMIGGEKPPERWRIGTEHEKLVFKHADHRAPSYDEPCGIRDLLGGLEKFGWSPVEEGGKVIALKGADGAVSLEPAGQLELSGAPLETLHQTCEETGRHLVQVKEVGEQCGVGYLGLGMWPDKTQSCRSCPRGAMRSCCGTCRASAAWAST